MIMKKIAHYVVQYIFWNLVFFGIFYSLFYTNDFESFRYIGF